ncbi:hypothetical protein ACFE04_023044 [Oxalis oulophora]
MSRLKGKQVSTPSVAETPTSLESEESEVPLIQRKSCRSKKIRSHEASSEDEGPTQKKVVIDDLATLAEDCNAESSSSPDGITVEKEIVVSITPDKVGSICLKLILREPSSVAAARAEMAPDTKEVAISSTVEARVNLKEGKTSGVGKDDEDNV